MSDDDVVIPAYLAQQIAYILKQSDDPAVQEIADIIDPPSTLPVISNVDSIINIINLEKSVNDTANDIISFICDKIYEVLSNRSTSIIAEEISNVIKNG